MKERFWCVAFMLAMLALPAPAQVSTAERTKEAGYGARRAVGEW